MWLKPKTAFPAQHIHWITYLKSRFKARLVHRKYSCRYLKQRANSLSRLWWVCPNKMPLSALLACYHDFSPLLLLCKVRDVMSFISPESPKGLELGDNPVLTELGWTRQITRQIRDSSPTSSLYGLGQQVVEMQWLAEPILMTQNRGAVTGQDKVWMACSNVEIIWHRDFTDAGEPSPVLKARSVRGHSHLVTVLLKQVLSGLRRRESRLVRKWNMLGENRTPHLKTLTKKTVFISARCLRFTFSSHRLPSC